MGAYLSEPVTEKISIDKCNERLSVGASSMQGWRVSQEDAHSCELEFDKNTSLFAVFDGHGGADVAQYCSSHLPQCIKDMESYGKGNMAQALEDAFLTIDKSLITPSVLEELKVIAGEGGSPSDEGDEDEVDHLQAEANMPIDQLIAKYRSNASSSPNVKFLSQENRGRFLRPTEQDIAEPGTSKESKENKVEDEKDSVPTSSSVQCVSNSGDCSPLDVANGSVTKSNTSDVKDTKDDNSVTITNGDAPKEKVIENMKISKARVIATCSKILTPILQREAKRAARSGLLQDNSDESEESDDDDFDGPQSSDDDDDEEDEENDGDENNDDEDEESDEDEEEEESGNEAEEFIIGEKEEPGYDSGCTAVVALLRNDELFVANAGDSRCVVSRNGKAIEMSHDHKPEDEIERKRIEAAGGNVTADGRVNGGLNLSRAIGDHSYKKNDKLDAKEQMISALPDIRTLTIDPQDEFMVVACDGIWNFMSSQSVIDFVRERLMKEPEREKLSTICEELFDKCLSPTTIGDGTGCDNMTCIVIKFKQLSCPLTTPCKRSSDTEVEHESKRVKTDDEK